MVLREEVEGDLDQTLIAYLVRQAYLVYVVTDPVDVLIARNFLMFHRLIQQEDVPVKDISAEFSKSFGMTLDDFWVVMFAVYAYYFLLARKDPHKWLISPTFFTDTPRNEHFNDSLAAMVEMFGRTQDELLSIYNSNPKYHDSSGRVGGWVSEFNILRDFPFVKLGPGKYCSPFPVFVVRRAIPGFYYDLLEEFANKERQRGNSQPYRNDMRKTFQLLYQRYVGLQLEQLHDASENLSPEFSYGRKGQKADSPDWILCRPNSLPIFFECKARQPALAWQSGATTEQIDSDIRQSITYALNQITKFLKRVDSKDVGTERFTGINKIIYALVMHDPFPFHALPDLADRIDEIANNDIAGWTELKDRIIFVPMSIRDLETAVGLEIGRGIPIEEQFSSYAEYRSEVTSRFVVAGGELRFPRHLEEFLQEEFNDARRIENPLIQQAWNEFADYVQQHIYDEPCVVYENEMREKWIADNAYFRWVEDDRQHGNHERHWQEAEAEYDRLEQELGEAPWVAHRLARYEREH